MMTLLCPHGDSNSSLGLERAPSWASRRWGRLGVSGRDCPARFIPLLGKRAGLYHPVNVSSIKYLFRCEEVNIAFPAGEDQLKIRFGGELFRRKHIRFEAQPLHPDHIA